MILLIIGGILIVLLLSVKQITLIVTEMELEVTEIVKSMTEELVLLRMEKLEQSWVVLG